MGSNRKSTATKGGKYMNPTDQARKEDRKKQLKKHKKQREQVREAVIKNKNPNTVLDELAKLWVIYFLERKWFIELIEKFDFNSFEECNKTSR